MQVLSDEHLFARDRSAEIQQGLDHLAEFAAANGDPALEAFVLSRRGLALHVQFLANPDAGESPEAMSLFERALEVARELNDQAQLTARHAAVRTSRTIPARSSASQITTRFVTCSNCGRHSDADSVM